MSVGCECCVLSGRGLCVGLITRPEESYRLWCGGLDSPGLLRHGKKKKKIVLMYFVALLLFIKHLTFLKSFSHNY